MNKVLTATLLAAGLVFSASGAEKFQRNHVGVNNLELSNQGELVQVSMELDVQNLNPGRNHEYCITPVIKGADGSDSIRMSSVLIAGRNMYIIHERDHDLEFDDVTVYRADRGVSTIDYSKILPRAEWFDTARIILDVQERNCCDGISYTEPVARLSHIEYTPVYNFVQPIGDSVKVREINKRAYINFPVNRTELYPTYMNNPRELAEIISTIDSVRADNDITIKSIFIKGFASPEGSYANNTRLARGRTETLKNYVENLYHFDHNFITTAFEPEDWQGLEEYVENSGLPQRDALLELIRSDMEPDAKDRAIRSRFPSDYQFLLTTVYPSLRHSDYRIEYEIRTFTTVAEILEVMRTAPHKLSLHELFHAAQGLTPGSDDYNEVFEVAVRLFPDSEVANINAAVNAMSRGEYARAEQYLSRAGDDPTAIYTRGVLAALQGNYSEAETYLAQAARLRVADAPAQLELVRSLNSANGYYTITREE